MLPIDKSLSLQAVDSADVTILVDNSIDVLLSSTEIVRRAPHPWDSLERPPLFAEHGYALLLTVRKNNHAASLLYDAGLGSDTLNHNIEVLGIQTTDIQAVVLSHGHTDHHGGLVKFLERLGQRGIPFVLHPDAWRDRRSVLPTGEQTHLAPPHRQSLEQAGAHIIESREPSLLLNNTVLVTGQIDRATDFEKGIGTTHHANIGGAWQVDSQISDDQAILCHVQGKGLVILSGCSHSGIVNILRYARRLTGIERVHAIVGGFHLSGKTFEPIIPRTVDELAAIHPDVIMPGHCTGWRAIGAIAEKMPEAFAPSCVGTQLHFTK